MALDDIKLASIAEISYLFTFGKYEFFQLIRENSLFGTLSKASNSENIGLNSIV